ncbi:MAG: ribosomal protein S18-alanine N-acetyltransferase [Gemmatimonadetes bacterium]|nr:ribosomal protein S18-alanine N-acetyltransferase [Gemmatimonadota bacterium]
MTSGAGLPFALRAMRPDDVDGVAAIEGEAFSDPWPARAFRDLLRHPSARLRVALEGGTLLGYCVVMRALDEGEVANIATAPTARRRGVAALLLDDAMSALARDGVTSLFLEVRESNTAARALYASRGFRAVGRRRGYYRLPDEDALVLRWSAPPVEPVATPTVPPATS